MASHTPETDAHRRFIPGLRARATMILTRRRSWRRLIPRLSVRKTMILVLVVGGGVGWHLRSVRIQREAVEALSRAGASVEYDWIWGDHEPFSYGERRPKQPPTWWSETIDGLKPFLESLGTDHFKRVVAVYSTHGPRKVDDALMAQVARLNGLKRIWIKGGVAVTNAGLAELEGLTSLKQLELQDMGPSVTDAGIAHLKGLVDIQWLALQFPGITGAGLDALQGMTRLEVLDLDGSGVEELTPIGRLKALTALRLHSTSIDDAGLAPVAGLGRLRCLDLGGTKVTDAGLVHLQGVTSLFWLILDETRVTDAGMASLEGLSKLEILYLNHTEVGDEGVRRLAGLASLKSLRVGKTRITDAGMRAAWGPDTYYLDHKSQPSNPNTSLLEYHRRPTR
ncbi:hypothetical protein [Paludisphaera borealis]|nr:hypothetical protein [Paludisphaera borealis]